MLAAASTSQTGERVVSLQFLLLIATAPVEVGVGPAIAAGPIVGQSDVAVAGPGLGASLRVGEAVYVAASIDAALPLFAASPRTAPHFSLFYTNPIASAGIGVGWRALANADVTAGFGGDVFLGIMPYSCGDCFNATAALGVAPHAFVSWRLLQWFALTARARCPIGLLGFSFNGQPFVSALVSVEPTITFGD